MEVEYIKSFDIGIMPLVDGPWEKGKCGYKLIQYMACSVPVIGSPVGVNNEIIVDNNCGFVASSNIEWEEYLNKLILNTSLRKQLGLNGRLAVENKYSLQVQSDRLLTIMNSIMRN